MTQIETAFRNQGSIEHPFSALYAKPLKTLKFLISLLAVKCYNVLKYVFMKNYMDELNVWLHVIQGATTKCFLLFQQLVSFGWFILISLMFEIVTTLYDATHKQLFVHFVCIFYEMRQDGFGDLTLQFVHKCVYLVIYYLYMSIRSYHHIHFILSCCPCPPFNGVGSTRLIRTVASEGLCLAGQGQPGHLHWHQSLHIHTMPF